MSGIEKKQSGQKLVISANNQTLRLVLCRGGRLCALSLLYILLNCSAPPEGVNTSEGIAEEIKSGTLSKSLCEDDKCCSEHKDCRRVCRQIFYKSKDLVKNTCLALPKQIVDRLSYIVDILKSPIVEDLIRLDLKQEFRLLLALDYRVFLRIIRSYNVNTARDMLIWLAENKEPVDELLQLEKSVRSKILYEILAGAGDRTKHGPVEEGLSQNASFDKSFFELLMEYSNYDLLQMTHEMIKNDLCSASQYASESQTELCILRIYCAEKYQSDNDYIHSEDLRNKMALYINDKSFFDYIENQVLHTGLEITMTEPIINNQVCFHVCHDHNKGCQ